MSGAQSAPPQKPCDVGSFDMGARSWLDLIDAIHGGAGGDEAVLLKVSSPRRRAIK
jgi:hypothetical protein